jgi:anti-sigma-K factor RskA
MKKSKRIGDTEKTKCHNQEMKKVERFKCFESKMVKNRSTQRNYWERIKKWRQILQTALDKGYIQSRNGVCQRQEKYVSLKDTTYFIL